MDIPTTEYSFSVRHLPKATPRVLLEEGAPRTAAHARPPTAELPPGLASCACSDACSGAYVASPRPAPRARRLRPAPRAHRPLPVPPRPPAPPAALPSGSVGCASPRTDPRPTDSRVEEPGSGPSALLARGRRRRPARPGASCRGCPARPGERWEGGTVRRGRAE